MLRSSPHRRNVAIDQMTGCTLWPCSYLTPNSLSRDTKQSASGFVVCALLVKTGAVLFHIVSGPVCFVFLCASGAKHASLLARTRLWRSSPQAPVCRATRRICGNGFGALDQGPNNLKFHKTCFACATCKKTLDSHFNERASPPSPPPGIRPGSWCVCSMMRSRLNC